MQLRSLGIVAAIALIVCAAGAADAPAFPIAHPIDGCANVYVVSEKLLSGGVPEGDTAFKALADAGIQTIISVDGAQPDVESARKYGIRYVHLPIGYDSVPRQRAIELSRAVEDLPGKIYVHCHHGKHRSPAAVAGIMVCSQGWSADRATAYMKQAGTSPNYTGLYETVETMRPAEKTELAKADSSFPETAKITALVDMMVHVDEHFEALTKSRKAEWGVPKDSPDLVPSNLALQIMELFHESIRTDQAKRSEIDFNAWMKQSETSATDLEKALRSGSKEAAEMAYKRLEISCKSCHEKYRNILQKK
ncbi:MAG: cytochrome c [Candidatus Hydrogenedentes bacterium]|nr:cytochrome c [Candidatus Hydrogenedentota bacterium]